MSKRATSAAEAVHQAALNVHNTNTLASDLRHAHVEPAVQHAGESRSMSSNMGTQQTVTAPVFHEQPREQMTTQSYQTSNTMASAPRTMETGTVRTVNTVQSVTRDAEAQIDAQVAEALAKSRALNAQDHARLQASIGSATASLEQQAAALKAQIDEEKRRAEADVIRAQQEKLHMTAERQAMEEKAILEAAAARKIELEQKSMRLQQEIEEITRRKTAEMMAEKPGNLQFVHEHQDTTVTAQLAGDIGHALDIKKGGHITQTTTGGEVQYHPVRVQETHVSGLQAAHAAEQSMATAQTHQFAGGDMHPMKAAPVTRAYDEQSTWAAQSDKPMAK